MDTQNELCVGTFVRWLKNRSFGFIAPDTSGPDIFVHKVDSIGEIPPPLNTKVNYKVTSFRGRIKAIEVQPQTAEKFVVTNVSNAYQNVASGGDRE